MNNTSEKTFVFEPGLWNVELVCAGTVRIRADGFAIRDADYIFTVLMRGDPHYEFEIASVPVTLVKDVWGGPEA